MRNSTLLIGILALGLGLGVFLIGFGVTQMIDQAATGTEDLEEVIEDTDIYPPIAYLNDTPITGVTLGITPEAYGKRVNTLLEPFELDVFDLTEQDWTYLKVDDEHEVKVFVVNYPKNIALIGSVDNDGNLVSLEYQLQTNKKMSKAVKEYSLLLMSATKALNPQMTQVDALNHATALITEVATGFNTDGELHTAVQVIDNKAYIAELSQFLGKYRIEPILDNQ